MQRPQQLFGPVTHQALASHTAKYLPAHLQKVPPKKEARKRRKKRQIPGKQKVNGHQTIPLSEFNAFTFYSRPRSKLTRARKELTFFLLNRVLSPKSQGLAMAGHAVAPIPDSLAVTGTRSLLPGVPGPLNSDHSADITS